MVTKVDPQSALIVGVVGGFGAAVTYILFKVADVVGPELSFKNLLPAPPPNPPIPRFMTKSKAETVKSSITSLFTL